jgi:hypothetical protein
VVIYTTEIEDIEKGRRCSECGVKLRGEPLGHMRDCEFCTARLAKDRGEGEAVEPMKSADDKAARFGQRQPESNLVSVLDYLPQELRTQLTRERLECLRTISELQHRVAKLEAEAIALRKQEHAARQAIAATLGEESGAQNTTEHITWLIRNMMARKNRRRIDG